MENNTPPNIILHKSKEIIFYISNNYKNPINIDLWKKELNLVDYKGLIIHSKCIFNRPPEIIFTVMLNGPKSIAAVLVIDNKPPFAAV